MSKVYYELRYPSDEFYKIGVLQKAINKAENDLRYKHSYIVSPASKSVLSYDVSDNTWKLKLLYVDSLVDAAIEHLIKDYIELFGAC